MKPIDIKFQCYIPKGIGKPLLTYFENNPLFRPERMTNYAWFKNKLEEYSGKGYLWFPEPDIGEPLGRYASTDDSYFHDSDHTEHTIRIGVHATIHPASIGSLEKTSPNALFNHPLHHYKDQSWEKKAQQHSNMTKLVIAKIRPIVGPRSPLSGIPLKPVNKYEGIFEFSQKRGVEPSLKPKIKDYQAITTISAPGTRIPNDASIINVKGAGGYPFLEPFAPDIDFDVTIQVKLNKYSKYIQVSVSGEHNYFPAYECIINNQVVYSFLPEDSGPGMINLNSSKTFSTKTVWIKLTDAQIKNMQRNPNQLFNRLQPLVDQKK
ncbi:hypothetical protein [Aquimarina pacifica]|uniref:hypothetical protein n=1 Tax=Aquimarina pacifica TaxID=1296415 RepID=UPI000470FFD8|nr:hypothetical protein [Aquimarina pacifica]